MNSSFAHRFHRMQIWKEKKVAQDWRIGHSAPYTIALFLWASFAYLGPSLATSYAKRTSPRATNPTNPMRPTVAETPFIKYWINGRPRLAHRSLRVDFWNKSFIFLFFFLLFYFLVDRAELGDRLWQWWRPSTTTFTWTATRARRRSSDAIGAPDPPVIFCFSSFFFCFRCLCLVFLFFCFVFFFQFHFVPFSASFERKQRTTTPCPTVSVTPWKYGKKNKRKSSSVRVVEGNRFRKSFFFWQNGSRQKKGNHVQEMNEKQNEMAKKNNQTFAFAALSSILFSRNIRLKKTKKKQKKSGFEDSRTNFKDRHRRQIRRSYWLPSDGRWAWLCRSPDPTDPPPHPNPHRSAATGVTRIEYRYRYRSIYFF